MKISTILEQLRYLEELSYPGNIGVMEVVKFHQIATPEQKALFKKLLADGKKADAWELIQQVTNVKLQGKEFSK